MWENRAEQSRFLYITFCEGLVPDAIPSFFGVANVEVTYNNPQGFRNVKPGSKVPTRRKAEKRNSVAYSILFTGGFNLCQDGLTSS